MIRHAALFQLRHASGSEAESSFLAALADLAQIPGVQAFQIWRETSPKNAYDFALSMTFVDQAAYDGYNVHPAHLAFVQERWIPEMAEFMEHDAVALER
jgi:hypothetical protein